MAEFFEVDSVILVDVSRGQSGLNADDLVALDVEFVQQVVVTLASRRNASRRDYE